jgi:hypothetical protein
MNSTKKTRDPTKARKAQEVHFMRSIFREDLFQEDLEGTERLIFWFPRIWIARLSQAAADYRIA